MQFTNGNFQSNSCQAHWKIPSTWHGNFRHVKSNHMEFPYCLQQQKKANKENLSI